MEKKLNSNVLNFKGLIFHDLASDEQLFCKNPINKVSEEGDIFIKF